MSQQYVRLMIVLKDLFNVMTFTDGMEYDTWIVGGDFNSLPKIDEMDWR